MKFTTPFRCSAMVRAALASTHHVVAVVTGAVGRPASGLTIGFAPTLAPNLPEYRGCRIGRSLLRRRLFFVCLATLGAASAASAQCKDLQKLTAQDGEVFDAFGNGVSISGAAALVGAHGDDDNGGSSGSAYMYHLDGSTWVLQQKLTAADAEAGDWFGSNVSLSGDVALIGAFGDDDNGSNAGAAYIFRFSGLTWVQEQKLTASDGTVADFFGASVSLSGNVAIVGAYGDDDNGQSSGSAYIFRFNGSDWVQEQKLTAIDGAAEDWFGLDVSVNGDIALVGASLDDDNGSNSGSAYIYRFNGSTWVHEQKLTASDAQADDQFGRSVSINGDVAIVGAPGDIDAYSGSAYLYRYNGSTWVQEQKLGAFDGAPGDRFGNSVDLSGDVAVVGAYSDDDCHSNSGSVYTYRLNGSMWAHEQKLTAAETATDDMFGYNVAISDETVVIGAPAILAPGSGSAHITDVRLSRLFADCNGNGIPDIIDLIDGNDADCNGNFIPDSCDTAFGFSQDLNGNGIPDECEDDCPSDLNGDGVVNVADLLQVLSAWGFCP